MSCQIQGRPAARPALPDDHQLHRPGRVHGAAAGRAAAQHQRGDPGRLQQVHEVLPEGCDQRAR